MKSLGNSECSPQTFLENSGSLDKLLIIIQNEDIAAHVHKVRAPPDTLSITVAASPAAADPDSNHTEIMAS